MGSEMCIRDRSSASANLLLLVILALGVAFRFAALGQIARGYDDSCLLYTSDAADERSSVDLGGRRIIQKKKNLILL